jgi:hypothetical protein
VPQPLFSFVSFCSKQIRVIRATILNIKNDLNITGLEVPLLLNFKESKLAWKRVVRVGSNEA